LETYYAEDLATTKVTSGTRTYLVFVVKMLKKSISK